MVTDPLFTADEVTSIRDKCGDALADKVINAMEWIEDAKPIFNRLQDIGDELDMSLGAVISVEFVRLVRAQQLADNAKDAVIKSLSHYAALLEQRLREAHKTRSNAQEEPVR